ncbi:carbohydrate ABC transporter permease [Carnobacterium gallinarum]|uniref:carbohydrate ABC transporter permease n=1 Tax=Carnobacterium gallinarum TaxID=2749 RepID=UPI00054D87E0|nr:sugar ABC transporter permease [Carnobacterium gallinarum]
MKKVKMIHFFIVPSLLGVFFLYLLPLFQIIFSVMTQQASKRFVGLDNVYLILKNEAFLLASKNTLLFMGISIPLLMGSSLLFSMVLHKMVGIFQQFKVWYILPLAIPAVSLSFFWNFFFSSSGMLNSLFNSRIDWLNTRFSFLVIVFIFIWKNFGYMVILWLGGMASISKSMIEAARIDGANERAIFLRIILPNLKLTAFVVYLLSIINSFKIFRDVYALAGDYPNEQIYLLQHLFNNWFRDFELDKMSAGTVLYVLALVVILLPVQKSIEKM